MSKQYPGGIISKTAPVPSGSYQNSTAPGIWTLEQQAALVKQGNWPTAGNVNPNAFIENLFSTYLYTGTGAALTITNGIDLSTNGGMVWLKRRSTSANNLLFDTSRGATQRLWSNLTLGQAVDTESLKSFTTTGFTLGTDSTGNQSAGTYVSWTFREQPKFFDIVTWTGNGTGDREISHNLGSAPGCIIIKCTSNDSTNWFVYHRALSTPDYRYMYLNDTAAAVTSGSNLWNVTSTTFRASSVLDANNNNLTYVAYLFAHDAGGFGLTGTDNVISCGSFTTSGGAATVNLGYEPQYILWKRTDASQNWNVYDTMRGWAQENVAQLYPNITQAEDFYSGNYFTPTSTGFQLNSSFGLTGSYIYVAIRRGPMAVPTVGTSVFYPNAVAQADSPDSSGVPFQPDLINTFSRDGSNRSNNFSYFQFVDRLRGAGIPNNTRVAVSEGRGLVSSGTTEEYGTTAPFTYVQLKANSQDITRGTGWNSTAYGNWIYYFLKRAPGFFDEVCYTGTGAAQNVTHNLAAVPELIICKQRSSANSWFVYAAPLGASQGVALNGNFAAFSTTGASSLWNETTPTSSVFSLGGSTSVNASAATYVAYLFGSVPGVSKVGSYTGTGAAQTINCGFTSGARFVLIRRTNSASSDWFVWDSARGIIPSNDPYLLINSTAAEVTGTDYVDTTSVGFDITSTAPAAINGSGDTFIFLAIA